MKSSKPLPGRTIGRVERHILRGLTATARSPWKEWHKMEFIKDVNGTISRMGEEKSKETKNRRSPRHGSSKRKFTGNVLKGDRLYFLMGRPGNFAELVRKIRWTSMN